MPTDTHKVLLVLPDSAFRSSLAAALEGRKVRVGLATTRGAALQVAQGTRGLVVVDLALAGSAPTGHEALEFMGELVRVTNGQPVFARTFEGVTAEALLAAGAADILEPTTDAALIAHRIVERLRFRSASRSDAAPNDFMARLGNSLQRARERESQAPVFVVRIPGRGARLFDDLRGALEDAAGQLECNSELNVSAGRIATLPVGEDGVAVLVPDLSRVQDAARFASALRTALASRVVTPIHIGVACSPTDGSDAHTLVNNALTASCRVLGDGQGEIVFHSEAMGRWAFERLTLEASLRNALQNKELVLYYQPRVDVETREIRGMEALLRWIHPQFGIVSPAQFIPLAEETGLIVQIGEWIVGEAARQNKAWRDAGLPRIRVSVNLSPVQFRRSDLFDKVAAAVRASGLEPNGLELEVTESLLMNDPTQTAATLRRFRELGLKLSIDDFGTGYSSLSYLKRFPIDALKIDRSFITDVTSNPDDAAIATAIILMGHSLKLKVVAEGVETENQLAFLRVLQCNEAQGYLFSPPVPAEVAGKLLASQRFALRVAA
jgi:EAL domain-containing protein (putative c-di-GMP-specific phosphodiesterase class I)/ActR/RegA family two-component response regulator